MDVQHFDLFYSASGISTDTRNISPDSLFICLKGESFDGNKFAQDALDKGAKHVIVDNKEYLTDTSRMTYVEDCVTYLQKLANYHRKKFNIPVIGITGSNGKTSTKELVNAVLSKKYNVLATIGNLNNHLGVPFTLLRLNDSHDIAIIEMGANRFKDIEELCAIAEPNYGIITNIGKAHLEGFGSFEGVLKTKRELYESVNLSGGKIIINADDDILTSILPMNNPVTSYGTHKSADIIGELSELNPFVVLKWSDKHYNSHALKTRMIGKYNFYNYLCAAACGVEFNVEPELISLAIEEYEPSNNRSQVTKTEKNTLILDCYNANPTSMFSALESFAQNSTSERKLAILGEMKELGLESKPEHQKLIDLIEKLNIEAYVVGNQFSGFTSANILNHFDSTEELIKAGVLKQLKNHLILLKGSRSVQLENLVDSL